MLRIELLLVALLYTQFQEIACASSKAAVYEITEVLLWAKVMLSNTEIIDLVRACLKSADLASFKRSGYLLPELFITFGCCIMVP